MVSDPLSRYERVEGMLHRSEMNMLYQFAKSLPPHAVAVEIGSFRGKSTLTIAQGLADGNGGILHAIDPHPDYFTYGEADGVALRKNVQESGLTNINVIEDYSDNVVDTFKEPIHLLWIDGNHTYDAVRADFTNYTPLLADGGVVAMHDMHLPGPWRVFVEQVLNNEGFDRVGFSWLSLYAHRGKSGISKCDRLRIYEYRFVFSFLARVKAFFTAIKK